MHFGHNGLQFRVVVMEIFFLGVIWWIIILMRQSEYRLLRRWLHVGGQERTQHTAGRRTMRALFEFGLIPVFILSFTFTFRRTMRALFEFGLIPGPFSFCPFRLVCYDIEHHTVWNLNRGKRNWILWTEGGVGAQQRCRKQSKWKSNLTLFQIWQKKNWVYEIQQTPLSLTMRPCKEMFSWHPKWVYLIVKWLKMHS